MKLMVSLIIIIAGSGNFNVILTGGDSLYFAAQLKNEIFTDTNFLFKGLYAISEINNCKSSTEL